MSLHLLIRPNTEGLKDYALAFRPSVRQSPSAKH